VKIIKATPSGKVHDTLDILDRYVHQVDTEQSRTEEPVTRQTFQAPVQVFRDLNPRYNNIRTRSGHEDFISGVALLKENMDMRDDLKRIRLNVSK